MTRVGDGDDLSTEDEDDDSNVLEKDSSLAELHFAATRRRNIDRGHLKGARIFESVYCKEDVHSVPVNEEISQKDMMWRMMRALNKSEEGEGGIGRGVLEKKIRRLHAYGKRDDCPNVEELSFRDDGRSESILDYLVDKLQLNVVEVVRPLSRTLSLLNVELEKLVLKDLCTSNIQPLLTILQNPPREIEVGIFYLESSRQEIGFATLEQAIKKIEKLTVSAPLGIYTLLPQPTEENMKDMVKKLQTSGREGNVKWCHCVAWRHSVRCD